MMVHRCTRGSCPLYISPDSSHAMNSTYCEYHVVLYIVLLITPTPFESSPWCLQGNMKYRSTCFGPPPPCDLITTNNTSSPKTWDFYWVEVLLHYLLTDGCPNKQLHRSTNLQGVDWLYFYRSLCGHRALPIFALQ